MFGQHVTKMMSKKKKKLKKRLHLTNPDSPLAHDSRSLDSTCSEIMSQKFSGQLSKYTNVVKGWQYRWFVLDSQTGTLCYYLNDSERWGVPRGIVNLQDGVVCPSEEDSHTFVINCANGDNLKLRAVDARARQEWVDRLRSVAENHTNDTPKGQTQGEHGIAMHSGLFVHGSHSHSPAACESFSSAKIHLAEAEKDRDKINKTIEQLSLHDELSSTDTQLLTLKACSQSMLSSLHGCVETLQYAFAAGCGFRPFSNENKKAIKEPRQSKKK